MTSAFNSAFWPSVSRGARPGAATRFQAVDPAVVVAMHPVPQGCRSISGPLRRLASRVAVQCQCDRQQPANLGHVVALAGRGPWSPQSDPSA